MFLFSRVLLSRKRRPEQMANVARTILHRTAGKTDMESKQSERREKMDFDDGGGKVSGGRKAESERGVKAEALKRKQIGGRSINRRGPRGRKGTTEHLASPCLSFLSRGVPSRGQPSPLSVCLSICLSVCLFIRPRARLSIRTHVQWQVFFSFCKGEK